MALSQGLGIGNRRTYSRYCKERKRLDCLQVNFSSISGGMVGVLPWLWDMWSVAGELISTEIVHFPFSPFSAGDNGKNKSRREDSEKSTVENGSERTEDKRYGPGDHFLRAARCSLFYRGQTRIPSLATREGGSAGLSQLLAPHHMYILLRGLPCRLWGRGGLTICR